MKTGTSFCLALFSMTGRLRQKLSQVHRCPRPGNHWRRQNLMFRWTVTCA